MAARAELINPRIQEAPQSLQDKHYYREAWRKCLLWAEQINQTKKRRGKAMKIICRHKRRFEDIRKQMIWE